MYVIIVRFLLVYCNVLLDTIDFRLSLNYLKDTVVLVEVDINFCLDRRLFILIVILYVEYFDTVVDTSVNKYFHIFNEIR